MTILEDEGGRRVKRKPWVDVLDELIKERMNYEYDNQFAEAIELSKYTFSKIKNGMTNDWVKGRVGKAKKPENLRKLTEAFILGKPGHPPAIRNERELDAFLDAVPYRLFNKWEDWRDYGKAWVKECCMAVLPKQAEAQAPQDEEKEEELVNTIEEAITNPYLSDTEIIEEIIKLLARRRPS